MSNNLFNTKCLSAYDCRLIAHSIGKDKDSYSISCWFTDDIETGVLSARYEVVQNWAYWNKKKELFTGTAKECVQYILDIVAKAELEEGVWTKDDRYNDVWISAATTVLVQ